MLYECIVVSFASRFIDAINQILLPGEKVAQKPKSLKESPGHEESKMLLKP